MTKREEADRYLKRIRYFDEVITCLQEETEELYERMAGISSPALESDPVQTSGSLDSPQERLMPKYLKSIEQCHQNTNRYLNLRKKIVEQVTGIKDWRYTRILYLTYIRGFHAPQIADEMNYGADYIRVLRGEALEAFFDRYLQKSTQNHTAHM